MRLVTARVVEPVAGAAGVQSGVGGRVLIIVQNLPVPSDRRVWLEACALRDAGFQVSVVSPKGPGDPSFEVLEGIRLRKYSPPPPASGLVSYAAEFAYCWMRTAAWSRARRSREGFDVIQACNPPDTYWALAAALQALRQAVRLRPARPVPGGLRVPFRGVAAGSGRLCYCWSGPRTGYADHVIVTNESYRRTAIERGKLHPGKVTVVRTGPDPSRLRKGTPEPRWRSGRRHLCAYLGRDGAAGRCRLGARAPWARREPRPRRRPLRAHGERRLLRGPRRARTRARSLRVGHLHGAGGRRDDRERAVHRGCRSLPRSTQPAERRVHDEQDDGVHGVRASGRQPSISGRRGFRPGRRPSTCPPTSRMRSHRRSSSSSTTRRGGIEWGRQDGPGSRRRSPGHTTRPCTWTFTVSSAHLEDVRSRRDRSEADSSRRYPGAGVNGGAVDPHAPSDDVERRPRAQRERNRRIGL